MTRDSPENHSSGADDINRIQLGDRRFIGVRPTREEVKRLLDEAELFNQQISEITLNPPTAENLKQARVELSRLATSRRVLRFIYNRMTDAEPDLEILGLRDRRGNLQATAMVSLGPNFLYVNLIATAPWNIISVIADERAVRGAGRGLMELIVRYNIDRGNAGEIKLTSKRESLEFYKNLGFQKDPNSSDELDLVLTTQAARTFLQKQQER